MTHSEKSNPRVSVDPNVHFGTPCVAGTRIPIRDILEGLQVGHSFGEITTDVCPDLDEADVQACPDCRDGIGSDFGKEGRSRGGPLDGARCNDEKRVVMIAEPPHSPLGGGRPETLE